MSDLNPSADQIVVSNKPVMDQAVSLLRTLLACAASIATALHFAKASGMLTQLADASNTIVGFAIAAAGLVALVYGQVRGLVLRRKAKALADLHNDDVAISK